ncbi:hypothetical protein MASR1M97_04530 [Candidatus Desulfobacillus denitrificans]
MENIGSDLITVFWIAAALTGIGLLIAGAERRVVIYYDGTDMAVTGLAVALLLLGWGLSDSSLFESAAVNGAVRWIVAPLLAIAGLFCMIANFRSAIAHNRSIALGLLVGLFKIVFLALSIVVILGQFSRLTEERTSFGDAVVAILLIAACVIVTRAMINGQEVYAVKGWVSEVSPFR